MATSDASNARAFSRLRHRPIARRDFAEALELLPPWVGLDDNQRREVAEAWHWLVNEPSMLAGVIEDMALPPGQRIQAAGATLIVPRSLRQTLDLDGRPQAFITRRIYRGLCDGSIKPMTDREIGMENARGELTMLILHFSQRDYDIANPYVQSVIACAQDTFRMFHEGYNLRAVYYETGEINDRVAVASGFIRRQYADSVMAQHLPPEHQPALYGLTREQAQTLLPGSPARNCFQNQPPLFTFSASQRRLLWFALFDDSDDTLMPLLDVSVHGLKKLWRGIYERIEDRMPEFFGDAAGGDEGKRGPEKRRQVLAYVRQRPEELRPWLATD
ncbi:hypothetical protein [Peristeroidobacter agariperforans]|uniref:hypothetical protein n=1 Tax=Peristeroidobacter agariperforans TaxID=268404 RepID=UPI00101C2978|nr:hypothetical protein [Peristeroidobacter agariperforans]